MARARGRMAELGVDALLCSVGPDLPYLTGYEAMPLERLTMLVVRAGEHATLVVPELERPRVEERPDTFTVLAWRETDDPIALVAGLVSGARCVAIGDQTWARFVLALQDALAGVTFRPARDVVGPLRAVKDTAEIEALAAAGAAVDGVAAAMRHASVRRATRDRRAPRARRAHARRRAPNARTSPSSPPVRTPRAHTTSPATA